MILLKGRIITFIVLIKTESLKSYFDNQTVLAEKLIKSSKDITVSILGCENGSNLPLNGHLKNSSAGSQEILYRLI